MDSELDEAAVVEADIDMVPIPDPQTADAPVLADVAAGEEVSVVIDATPAPEPQPSARQAQRAATRATKEALIAQAELVAMISAPKTAPGEMKALLEQWKQAGRITKAEDDALWARFNDAQNRLFTRLDLLREQRQTDMAEAKRLKEGLISTAEEVATRSDLRQAQETMTSLMTQWKAIGPAPDDRGLWLRFKAAHDQVYERRQQDRRQSQTEQREAAAAKAEIIARVKALIGTADLRRAHMDVRDLQAEFREAGYAGREPNKALFEQLRAAVQEFYAWARHEPGRRRDTGEQGTYSRRARLVAQIEQVRSEIRQAETSLASIDAAGAKRSHGRSITLTLGQVDAYSSTAAEAMRAKVRLADLESQLARLDSTLTQPGSQTQATAPDRSEDHA